MSRHYQTLIPRTFDALSFHVCHAEATHDDAIIDIISATLALIILFLRHTLMRCCCHHAITAISADAAAIYLLIDVSLRRFNTRVLLCLIADARFMLIDIINYYDAYCRAPTSSVYSMASVYCCHGCQLTAIADDKCIDAVFELNIS